MSLNPTSKNIHFNPTEVVRSGILQNPNRAVLKLAHTPKQILSKISEKQLHIREPEGWRLLADLISHKEVTNIQQLRALRREVALCEAAGFKAEHFQSARDLFRSLTNIHHEQRFEDLKSLCKFFRSTVVISPNPSEVIKVVERFGGEDSNAKIIEKAITDLQKLHEMLPTVIDKSRIPEVHQQMITCVTEQASPSALRSFTKFIVNASTLPEFQRDFVLKQLPTLFRNEDFSGPVDTIKLIQTLESICLHTARWHGVPKEELVQLQKRILAQLENYLENPSQVSELVGRFTAFQSAKNPSFAPILELLEAGVDIHKVRALANFAYKIPFPLEKLPLSALEVKGSRLPTYLSMAEGQLQSKADVEKLTTLLLELKEQGVHQFLHFKEAALKLSPKFDDDAILMCATLETQGKRSHRHDIELMQSAKAEHDFLTQSGIDNLSGAKLAWAYVNSKPNQSTREMFNEIAAHGTLDGIASAVRRWAQNESHSLNDFFTMIKIIARARPEEWEEVQSFFKRYSVPTDLIGRDMFRSAIRSHFAESSEVSPEAAIQAVKNRKIAEKEQKARAALIGLISAKTRETVREFGAAINSSYHTDTGPYVAARNQVMTSEYQTMIHAVIGIYRGCFEQHLGASHLAYECRTPASGHDWLMARFGADLALRTDFILNESHSRSPGAGCFISGLQFEKIFAENPSTPQDPYSTHKHAWPWLKNEFPDLASTRFLNCRGVRIIMGPPVEKYKLDGVHYSFAVWNDHFHNPNLWVAALVPTSLITEKLKGKLKSSLSDSAPSLSDAGSTPLDLTYDSLSVLAAHRKLNLLNLGWASNLGGLCNAYPSQSAPHFLWERPLMRVHSRDGAEHIHKSHITGAYSSSLTPAADRLLDPIRILHTNVHEISSAYLNLTDLFRISLSTWHKGLTITESDDDANDSLELVQPERNEEEILGQYETRMLEEAYRWHELRKTSSDQSKFPVLCIAPTLSYWGQIDSPMYLDTFDLHLTTPTYQGILPEYSRGTGAFEITIWKNHVRPLYYDRYDLDLRFMNREELKNDWRKA